MCIAIDREHVVDAGARCDCAVVERAELDRAQALEHARGGELGDAIAACAVGVARANAAAVIGKVQPDHRGLDLVAVACAIVDVQGLGKEPQTRYAADRRPNWVIDALGELHQRHRGCLGPRSASSIRDPRGTDQMDRRDPEQLFPRSMPRRVYRP